MAEIVPVVFPLTADVVMVNAGDTLCPPATVTVDGTPAAVFELPSATTAPVGGAGPFKVTVPEVDTPPTTEFGARVTSEGDGGATVKMALAATPL